MASQTFRVSLATRFRTCAITAQPCRLRIGLLHRVPECNENGAAEWRPFLVAGLRAALRVAPYTTSLLVDLSRRTFASAPLPCPPSGYANVVPAGGFSQRLAQSSGGCRFTAAGPAGARHPVRLSSRFLDLSG